MERKNWHIREADAKALAVARSCRVCEVGAGEACQDRTGYKLGVHVHVYGDRFRRKA